MIKPCSIGIIGGGPVGLTLHLLLKNFGISSLVLEKRSRDSALHPQAHYLSCRSLEVLRSIAPGTLDKCIIQASGATKFWNRFAYCSDLENVFAQKMHFKDEEHLKSMAQSPVRPVHLSQSKLVPILENFARNEGEESSSGVVYDSVVEEIKKSKDSEDVQVFTQNNAYRFDVVVGADGARSLTREVIGGKLIGDTNIQKLVNIHFKSQQLAKYLRENTPAMLYFIYNSRVVCVLVAHDICASAEGEFVCQIPIFPPHETLENDYSEEKRILDVLYSIMPSGISDLTILSRRQWTMNALVSDKYFCPSSGKIFIAGDAAHQFPPSGGFGLNTGLQDVHNLAWKLAMLNFRCEGKPTTEKLLELGKSYEEERKPIARETLDLSLLNYDSVIRISNALGLNISAAKFAQHASCFLPLPETMRGRFFKSIMAIGKSQLNFVSQATFDRVSKMISEGAGLPLLFMGQDFGFAYENGCGKGSLTSDPFTYTEILKPGHRFPHRWITNNSTSTGSSLDLFGSKAHYVLITSNPDSWSFVENYHVDIINASLFAKTDLYSRLLHHDFLVRPDGVIQAIGRENINGAINRKLVKFL